MVEYTLKLVTFSIVLTEKPHQSLTLYLERGNIFLIWAIANTPEPEWVRTFKGVQVIQKIGSGDI